MRKITFFSMLLLFFFSFAYASGKTYVFFTCDVESTSKGNPERDIWGKRGNEYWGITRIMDILDKHGIKGTFFVNVYEEKKFGRDELAKICQEIDKRGHDVELHTHPQYAFPGVYGMQDADLATQIEIIRYGKSLIREWIGKEAIAHRAGAYAANEHTLEASLENGIFIDSSRNYAYAKYQGLISKSNAINSFEVTVEPQNNSVFFEIPVTTYYQFKFGKLAVPRILDLESTSLAEFRRILQQAIEAKVGTIVIMSHSFSFSRYNPHVAKNMERKLAQLMVLIKDMPELEPITFEEFFKTYASNRRNIQNGDFMPITGLFAAYLKSWQRLEQGRLNQIVAFSPIFALAFSFMTIMGVKKCSRKS